MQQSLSQSGLCRAALGDAEISLVPNFAESFRIRHNLQEQNTYHSQGCNLPDASHCTHHTFPILPSRPPNPS